MSGLGLYLGDKGDMGSSSYPHNKEKKKVNHQICALRGSKGEIIGLRVKKK